MLKTALVAMTLMGCDCDARICVDVGEAPVSFASMADCNAAMDAQIAQRGTAQYPLMQARCVVRQEAAPDAVASAEPPVDESDAAPASAHTGFIAASLSAVGDVAGASAATVASYAGGALQTGVAMGGWVVEKASFGVIAPR